MTTPAWILGAVAAVAMAVDWWAVSNRHPRAEEVAKPLVMLGLIGVAILADIRPSSAQLWIVAALLLGLLGDVCLLPRYNFFLPGLAAFLLGHSAYLAAFSLMWSPSWMILVGLVGVAILAGGFGVPIARALRGSAMLVPVMAYVGITIAIIVVGAATGRWVVAAGALAFALSDGLLGADRFVRAHPERRVWVHVLYHSGQAAILAGAIGTS